MAEGLEPRSSKVLLVDDSRSSLIRMARALVGLETDIHLAQSAELALKQIDENQFSVVLMGAQMSGADGFSTVSAIREHPNGAAVPLIFISDGEQDEAAALERYDIGAVDILTRPLKRELLRSKVNLFIRLDRQRRALELSNRLLEEQRRHLERLVQTDPITEVLNRRGFEAALSRTLVGSDEQTQRRPIAVVMFGCDDFGDINGRYGHGAGDAVLRTVAARIRGSLRDGDVLARIGGDEFLALLPGAALTRARELAERARAQVSAKPIIVDDGEAVIISVSAGVAMLPWDTSSMSEVLARTRPLLRESKA